MPEYDLELVKQLAREKKLNVQRRATRDYKNLGFTLDEVIEVILLLKSDDFHKVIVPNSACDLHMDVYKTTYMRKVIDDYGDEVTERYELYIKVKMHDGRLLLLCSFKQQS